ncbi:MAG TPA: ABC-2 family transporter protein [Symbiobacteriaceae bacterium]|nr:ABC-2 family transporter protein [Symbiobacteriaceae bacterium]
MGKLLALVGAYLRANIAIALEYRFSLVSQVTGMFVNDALWIGFWVLYFIKFPVLGGWTLEDVVVLWATLALSWGLVTGLMSNAQRIPTLVVQGQLDYYLSLPKDVLLHLLISQIRLVSFGDALFGVVVFLVFVKLTWVKVLVFLSATLLASIVWLGLLILSGSLTFYLGNSEAASGQIVSAVLHFASYPMPIFDNAVKLVLFTLLPAGLISSVPVDLVREFRWPLFLELLAGAGLFLGAGIWAFRRGLKRYESGNLMMMRS